MAWPLRFCHAKEPARIVREAGEDCAEIVAAEMLRHDFAEDAAIIRGNCEVASLVKVAIAHSRPARINLSALDIASHQQHAIRMAMIGAAVAVLMSRAGKFGHAH